MKIGVTGASGQLGRLVVQRLLESCPATDVVAVVRDPSKAADLAAAGVEVRVADYNDRPSLDAAFAGLDRLLLVSSNEVGRRVPQHINAIEAAKGAGVRHVVYTSAPRATTSDLILAPEHKATEEYLASTGLSYTVLRNNWYTENYVQMLEQARTVHAVLTSAGDGRVASATRADYAAAASTVLRTDGHDGAIYELAGDEPWTFDDLAAAIGEILGTEVVTTNVSPDEHLEMLRSAGLDTATAGFVVAMNADIRAGRLAGGTHELSQLIGRPTTPLKESVKKMVS
jgi:NAD(P)H dehydrogenase (quinone)